MSFLKTLETIGQDILKGVEIAGPVVGAFVPAAGPIFTEVATVITALEAGGQHATITAAQLSQIIQAVALVQSVKQAPTVTPPGS